jgi:hypothetical protein
VASLNGPQFLLLFSFLKHIFNRLFMPAKDEAIVRMAQPRRVMADETLRMLRGEIQACVQSCRHGSSGLLVPTRLLELGVEGDAVRLVESKLLSRAETPIRYAALSYCWGSPDDARKQSKTDRASLNAHMSKICMEDLSPVIRDAISVTRMLDIRFLWVDSLCIIQGDQVDWQQEARGLGDFYSNAYVTLCVLKSASCQMPFLPCLTTHSPGWYDPGTEKAGTAALLMDLIRDMQQSAWAQRGWTFQEEKLCARAVYFGDSGVHFECGNWVYIEGRRGRRAIYETALLDTALGAASDPTRRAWLASFWRLQLVPQIMRRRFSILNDRLPSLSGLARTIGEGLDSRYAAGLWEDCLYIDLAWQCVPQHSSIEALVWDLKPDHEEYIAPSWSWARRANGNATQVLCLITGENVDDVEAVARTKTKISASNIDKYGRVEDGYLEVSASVLNVNLEDELSRQDDGAWVGFNASLFGRVTLHLDWELEMWDRSLQLKVAFLSNRPTSSSAVSRNWYGIVLYTTPDTGRSFRVGVCACQLINSSHVEDLDHETIVVY